MERVLEPELMEDSEQAHAYAGADFEEAHQSYVRLFRALFPSAPTYAVALDLGCGPADVTRRFAREFPNWTIHGIDGSPAMLAQARQALSAEPDLAARVRLSEGFLPGTKIADTGYDVILSTSLLHHLHDPQGLWQTIRRGARPGALLFVADLARPHTPEQAAALVALYSGSEPDILKRDFYNSLRAAFTSVEVQEQLRIAGLGSLQVEAISDRHLVIWGRMPQNSGSQS